jgi:hypothetical protein
MACLYALTQKLGDALQAKSGSDKKIDTEDVKRVFGQATSRLANVLKQTKVGVGGLISIPVGELVGIAAENDLSKQMLEFKLNFSELVAQWAEPSSAGGKRVVICIDDLDRIEPLIALEMLESIKIFLDVEGCVFVLAVDYEVVQEGMKKNLVWTCRRPAASRSSIRLFNCHSTCRGTATISKLYQGTYQGGELPPCKRALGG